MKDNSEIMAAATLAAVVIGKMDLAEGSEGIADVIRVYRTIYRKLKNLHDYDGAKAQDTAAKETDS